MAFSVREDDTGTLADFHFAALVAFTHHGVWVHYIRVWVRGIHTCEPAGHNPFLGPAQKQVVKFNLRNPGAGLKDAEFVDIYIKWPDLFQPIGNAVPPPGFGAMQLAGPPPPPPRQQLPSFQGMFFLGQLTPPMATYFNQQVAPQHLLPPYHMQQQAPQPGHALMPTAGSNHLSYHNSGQPQQHPFSHAAAMPYGAASHHTNAVMQNL